MNKTTKIALTGMTAAFGALTGNVFYIPLGAAKAFPIQHLLNVLTGVLLGPWYALAQAFIVSFLRNMMGTGTIFAFPGSMFGALLAGLLFKKSGKITYALLGEAAGTGILGAIVCCPISIWLLGKQAALFGFIPSFLLSSVTGGLIGAFFLRILMRNPILIKRFNLQKGKREFPS
ncbi:energy coupling factor transporter S component ThiW [Falsibacillus pallidus]|uniref:Energy coupling factor transporter S component ThiW n=1 Tax=Falsibacillus pallidus TaxID=493781 RepID=A0A370GV19_9BACI|nr:energy coupling factor transporter S component ThiW [Falsibacillus pallidus]RDI47371.1 energy coupling factor transporter S component ThiW [Falsibacillus pallidus]